MGLTLKPFNPSRHIETDQDVYWTLRIVLEGGIDAEIARAARDIINSPWAEKVEGDHPYEVDEQ